MGTRTQTRYYLPSLCVGGQYQLTWVKGSTEPIYESGRRRMCSNWVFFWYTRSTDNLEPALSFLVPSIFPMSPRSLAASCSGEPLMLLVWSINYMYLSKQNGSWVGRLLMLTTMEEHQFSLVWWSSDYSEHFIHKTKRKPTKLTGGLSIHTVDFRPC